MPSITFLSGPHQDQTIEIPAEGMTLGRNHSCDVQIIDTKVSNRHAALKIEDGYWWIYDLESSNGTRLNSKPVKAGRLSSQDEISIGDSVFTFQLGANDEKPPAPLPQASSSDDAEETDTDLVKQLNVAYLRMKKQLSQVIVGQDAVIDQMLIAIFCRSHALLVGVPGLAKTLLISTLSHVLDLKFKRIQFTPDLMPADITGTEVLEEDPKTGAREFRFVKGPIFANMVLADEINRTPPKTQAALLEAMQEHHVTVGGETRHLPEPFFVLATQNPIEQEGTYPLPEAQLDRFMFNITVDYPSSREEQQIIRQVTGTHEAKIEVALSADEVLKLQQVVKRVPVANHVIEYASNLARATRPKSDDAPDFVKEMVSWGAGPRAGINLVTAAKARAILQGRYHCTTEDIKAIAHPVLRHRILTTFNAEAAGVTPDEIINMLLAKIPTTPEIEM
jgi:MoxR-like ATPase